MSQLPKRILSALVVVLAMVATHYFFGRIGMLAMAIGVVILGICEYGRMAFNGLNLPSSFKAIYIVASSSALILICFAGNLGGPLVFFLFPVFIGGVLWSLHKSLNNKDLLMTTLLSAVGFIYLVCFSSLSIRFLLSWDTEMWFWLLLTIVIATDVFAYFTGLTFGKRKIMPSVSPKKTWAGSFGGFVGAAFVAYLFRNHIESIKTWELVLTAVIASGFAQSGDLFESLLKRVADVKDSGGIMPGHGGVLDRLDGILFASPVLFFSFMLFVS